MAFKKILEFLKGKNILEEVKNEALTMLQETKSMYQEVNGYIFERIDVDVDVYQLDKKVNKTEIEIRKKILEHLVLSTDKNELVPSLIITSIVIDIERIGDYCKNMFELVNLYPDELKGHKIVNELKEISAKIEREFDLTYYALSEGDKGKAEKVMKIHGELGKRCDEIPGEVLKDETIDKKMAVITVLLARYLKRVSAHLWNISSSVLNPFPRIGYHPESKF